MTKIIDMDDREPFGVFEFFEKRMAAPKKEKRPAPEKSKSSSFANFMVAIEELHLAQTGGMGYLVNDNK